MLALLELIIMMIMIFQKCHNAVRHHFKRREATVHLREETVCSMRASALSLLGCLVSCQPDDVTSGKIWTGSSFTNHYGKWSTQR